MDKIKLVIKKDDEAEFVDIYINEKRLVEMLREIELQYEPKIAGEYRGLPQSVVFFPSRHFLDEPDKWYLHDDKVSILECVCGSPGCWDFNVKITIEDDKVIWSEFEQPLRSVDSAGGYWNYDKIKPIVFDRKQYEAELSKMA
ncbi:hypothetical protein [Sporosarcina limicola]|uniref:Uncharacterized protein n=1 Tax=Sporosarcina limicola TaxID=34101 RepID=A0A927MIY2_9BACL|nr:hypothetical protein [Sporosarcina limicola]MBE1554002.1 hypothetical protein [Sporosarcina limicola]